MKKDINPFLSGTIMLMIISIIMLMPLENVFIELGFSSFQIQYMVLALKMLMIFLVALLFVKMLNEKALSGLSSKHKWSFKYLNLIPFYLFVLGILTFIDKDLSGINYLNFFLLLIACLLVGFAEEFVFRGYLQPIFIKKYIHRKNGVFFGVFFPALFFGISHLLNLTVNENIIQVIAQSIYAVFIGFFFGVVLIKTNKIIPLAITHGLINFFFLFGTLPNLSINTNSNPELLVDSDLTTQILSSLAPILIFFPLFVIGLVLLRKIKREVIQKRLHV